ncbi:MAG: dimethylarginine dimethylaminohydrolase family protein [Bdellovibrionales bacterium]
MNQSQHAAYQGRGWKARRRSQVEEMSSLASPWQMGQVNSEWSPLKKVLLYRPNDELKAIKRPNEVQHLRPVLVPRLRKQLSALATTYRSLGIAVEEIKTKGARHLSVPPNLMFVRDLFFTTREGVVLARMASEIRAGEEALVFNHLATSGTFLRGSISGRATFEGADALWLDCKTVLVGVGNRTNAEGFRQLESLLATQGIKCLKHEMPGGAQHLLGLLQIVDRHLALVRHELTSKKLISLLRNRGFQVHSVPESREVCEGLGFNFVTVAPKKIIMAAHCPELKNLYQQLGLQVLAEIEIDQLVNAAGGIACATGILDRQVVR